MAISKDIKTSYGIDASYHMIATVSFDRSGKCGSLYLLGWANESARRAEAPPLTSTSIEFGPDAYVQGRDDASLYAIAKADPVFAGATDC